jgi:hypothetical protein
LVSPPPSPPSDHLSRRIAIADSRQRTYTSLDETVYLLGSYDQGDPTANQYDLFQVRKLQITQILARATVRDLLHENFDQYEILMTPSLASASSPPSSRWIPIGSLGHHPSVHVPRAILPGSIAEGSLHFNEQTERWTITSLDVLEAHLRVCSSASALIEDDWSCLLVSGIEPKWKNDKRYLTYAGKSHPEFLSVASSRSPSPRTAPVVNLTEATGQASLLASSSMAATALQANPFHGVLSYVANPLRGPEELFDEPDRETYCPSFLYF